MAREYAQYRPRPADFRSHPDFAKLRKRTVKFVDASVAPFKPAMHNPAMHFRLVRSNGMAAARLYARRNPHLAPFISVVLEYFELALYAHDTGHCACTFRAHAPRGLFLSELGVNLSAEWVTSFAVNDFMASQGVPLPARLFQTGIFWASTYGAEAEEGQRLKLPSPKPRTIWGAMMRAADISPALEDTIRNWFRRSAAVTYGEIPAFAAPQTWEEYTRRELEFVGYCRRTMGHMDDVAGFKLSVELGWSAQLDKIVRAIHQLRDRRSPVSRFVQREQAKYGVRLR